MPKTTIAATRGNEMNFLDAHCHLQHAAFSPDLPQVILRAKQSMVRKAVCTGSSPAENQQVLELKKRFPGFLEAVVGISPHEASGITKKQLVEELARMKLWAEEKQIIGVGEIGLDHHWFKDRHEHDAQEHVFREQLSLAQQARLPVVIHSRKAEEKVFEILGDFPHVRVMLHCFLKPALAREAASRGWMVSLPTLKSESVKKIVERISLEKLFCETDSPFLWKNQAGKAERNEPRNVVFAYEQVAAGKKLSLSQAAEAIWLNARKFFAIK